MQRVMLWDIVRRDMECMALCTISPLHTQKRAEGGLRYHLQAAFPFVKWPLTDCVSEPCLGFIVLWHRDVDLGARLVAIIIFCA